MSRLARLLDLPVVDKISDGPARDDRVARRPRGQAMSWLATLESAVVFGDRR
jgi:hypothetical protein